MSSLSYVHANDAPKAIGPYSQAIVFGGLLYSAGQVPLDPATGNLVDGDIRVQTDRVLKNLAGVLLAAHTSLGRVLKTTVYLADMADFAAMNEVYATHFGDHKPARATVAVKTLPKNALVEIDCIAAL